MDIERTLSMIWTSRPKFQSDHNQVVLRVAGVKMAVRPWSYDLYVIGEVFLEEVYAFRSTQVPDLPVVVDLGANIGSFSLWAALKWNPARVIAVEMDEGNFNLLDKNIRLNGLNETVTPVKVAIWDQNGQVRVKRHGFNHGLNEVCSGQGRDGIPAVTIEKLMEIAGLKKIDIMKMDIEGAEERVINQANEDLFASSVGSLIVELHPTKGVQIERIIRRLEKAGFEVHLRQQLFRSTAILEAVNKNF